MSHDLTRILLATLGRLSPVAPIPLPEWRDAVLALYRAKAKTTPLRMAQALRELVALAGDGATTADLAPALIARFAAARPDRRPATTNGLLRALRAACNLAVAAGQLAASPFALGRYWVGCEAPRGHR